MPFCVRSADRDKALAASTTATTAEVLTANHEAEGTEMTAM
jgi:hypothetical protein